MSDALDLFDTGDAVRKRTATVKLDAFTEAAAAAFDIPFTGTMTHTAWPVPRIPEKFGVGAIVGPSGTGKSILLSEFGTPETHEWDASRAIVSQVAPTPEEALEVLSSVGLNTIPSWLKPFHVLSLGEQFRANLARGVRDGAVFDEFTSVVDRHTAMSASRSLRRYIDQRGLKGIVVATCHEDILPWLNPDWTFHTDTGTLSVGRSVLRPTIDLDIYPCGVELWPTFAPHHYLTADINPSARCFLVVWGETVVGFWSVITLPSGTLKNAWREHRTVVLPQFQGLGFGTRVIDRMAHWWVENHGRFFSRTAHPRLASYRDASLLWRSTSHSRQLRRSTEGNGVRVPFDSARVCAAHEYVGAISNHSRLAVQDDGVFDLFGDG